MDLLFLFLGTKRVVVLVVSHIVLFLWFPQRFLSHIAYPQPLGPTIAIFLPAGIVKLTSFRIGLSG